MVIKSWKNNLLNYNCLIKLAVKNIKGHKNNKTIYLKSVIRKLDKYIVDKKEGNDIKSWFI